MSILASSVQTNHVISNVGRLQSEIDRLLGQQSSGKKTDRFSGLGIEARRSIELRANYKTYERYQNTISQTNLNLQFQLDAMTQMNKIIDQTVSDIIAQQSGAVPNTQLLNQTAEGQLGELISLMNSQYDGRYLFGGRGVTDANVLPGETRPPVLSYRDDTAVPDTGLPGVNDYFTMLTTGALNVLTIGDEAVGDTGADRAFARLDYIFNNSLTAPLGALVPPDAAAANSGTPNDYAAWYNGDLGQVPAGTAAATRLTAEIADGLSVNYNSLIVDPNSTTTSGYEDILKAMSLLASFRPSGGSITPSNETEVLDLINRSKDLLLRGQEKLQSEISRLGETQALVNRQEERNILVLDFTEVSISTVEDVDYAKVAAQLFQRQSQLESSYQLIGELRNLRLSNFL